MLRRLARLKTAATNERMGMRFLTTVLANLTRAGLSFGSGILTARGLGVSHYGDLSFLLASFGAISQFTDVGSANAFYTFISHRRRTVKFFALYTGWVVGQFLVTFAVVALALPTSVVHHLWVGNDRGLVLLALVSTFLAGDAWGMAAQMGEARRKTALVQGASALLGALHLVLIAIAAYQHWLTVKTVMLLMAMEYALLLGIYGPRLLRLNLEREPQPHETAKSIVKEFAVYCGPLVLYAWVSVAFSFTDRWLLQRFGGSAQQGFFSVAQQFSAISIIAANSMVQIFWKEFAEAHGREDLKRMKYLCDSAGRILYFVCAWISCLFIPYARQILIHTVGKSYEAASLPLTIMFIYPLHTTLNQVYSTALYASQETKKHARIGVIMMLLSIPITYFILAPGSAIVPGFDLGAVGLALKMVTLQIVWVSWEAWMLYHINQWDYDFKFQGVILGLLLGLGWLSKFLGWGFLGLLRFTGPPIWGAVLAGILYAAFTSVILYQFPQLVGRTQDDRNQFLNSISQRVRSFLKGKQNL